MNTNEHRTALPEGQRLLWYRIDSILGQGGFGITYLAEDTNLNRKVAIKEYLPIELVVREGDNTLQPHSKTSEKMYRWGLERFVIEAQTLAKFNHPNIIRVHNVFEANNTAYMVMEYEQGESLASLIQSIQLDVSELLKLVLPILDGLEYIHDTGFIHRDIKPANIYVRSDGIPILLDFGSARMALGTQTQNLTGIVSPGYAPYEQYSLDGQLQGPWTDIYGLGATLYRVVVDKDPLDSITRSNAVMDGRVDPLVPASLTGNTEFTPGFLHAIDEALNLFPKDRPQNIFTLREKILSSDDITYSNNQIIDSPARPTVPSENKTQINTQVGPKTRASDTSDTSDTSDADIHTSPSTQIDPSGHHYRKWVGMIALLSSLAGAAFFVYYGQILQDPAIYHNGDVPSISESLNAEKKPVGEIDHYVNPLKKSDNLTDETWQQQRIPKQTLFGIPIQKEESVPLKDLSERNINTDPKQTQYPVQLSRLPSPRKQQGFEADKHLTDTYQNHQAEIEVRRQAIIADLLVKAEQALQSLRLTSPQGDNAAAYYRELLALDPNNAQAIYGIEHIAGRYLSMANKALAQGKQAKARTYLDNALTVDPNSEDLKNARDRIEPRNTHIASLQSQSGDGLTPTDFGSLESTKSHTASSKLVPQSKFKLLVLIDEKIIGDSDTRGYGESRQAEQTLIEKFSELGFIVIDSGQARRNLYQSQGLRLVEGNTKAAAVAGLQHEAQLSIIGTAVSNPAGNKLYSTQMQSIHATVTARLIRNNDARVLTTASASATKAHIDKIRGGVMAIEAAAEKLATRLSDKVLAQQIQREQTGHSVTLNINGLLSYRHLDFIVSYFQNEIIGVNSASIRNYTEGVADVGIDYLGQMQELARFIADKNFLGYHLEPTSVSSNRMELTVVLDKPGR